MKQRNPRFGCPRIAHQSNLAFGLDLDKDIVRRVFAVHFKPDPNNRGPSWRTAIGHAKDSLWSVDLFRCESLLLKSHWVMVVMDQYTRRIVGFGVHAGSVHGQALCRMFNEATSSQGWPTHISSDNDPLFQYHRWKANLRVLDIDEIKSLPHVPMSHPFVERLIGSIRRELLDQTLFWTEIDLENKLRDYKNYYNQHRCHSSREGVTPFNSGSTKAANINNYRWKKHCRGLFELPVAA
jgi:putative transposase